MSTEVGSQDLKREGKRRASALAGGIFLVCLGVLLATGWWWPGIMFAVGLASGAELVFRGRIGRGAVTMAFFWSIPLAIWVIQQADIPWTVVGPTILIGLGLVALVKAFVSRAEVI